ncbi:DUF499 domain-containing protein [Thiohalocapsa sp. ML1]|uniref:DUF499 domain-containing protein n=1 Tax=Thiohalocapsa sp. ML1 TaxID=1431688 RepID=UPI000731FC9C|nr:DUF499 domain-containing protein [Thiohalocapsa sp. ML1]
MLGLELRAEFKGRRLKGTAIELTDDNNTGATQVSAADFLRITYPSNDVLKTIEAAGPGQGRPITLKGERGQGKSHLMAALYHALTDQAATQHWLNQWSHTLGDVKISQIPLRGGMHVISDSLHRQRYKYLWDLLFDNHPHGGYCRGKWEGLGAKKTDVPSDEILLDLFQHTPTALILDEFQTWYDGLADTRQERRQAWAFNFIQILSEIAARHPDLLLLVVSVRNGHTDAFQQIQRVNPVIVDFAGPSAKRDRLRLLLHRLFENRLQVPSATVETLIDAHIQEYARLKDIAPADQARQRTEFVEAWPFAPHLMDLLEDQVLIATSAQGTRDLIRILAELYKRHGARQPILTAADFRLDDDASGITALLDSVANQHHAKLREKALRNLEAVQDAVANAGAELPHHEQLISALWLRSLAEVNQAGADRVTLQADVTRDKPVDDNAFLVELGSIVENSFNIHEDGNRYIFREEENPRAKLIASARNDKLFQQGDDARHLAKETRYVLEGSADVDLPYRVVVLPAGWKQDPWTELENGDNPPQWGSRIPILVLPDAPPQPEALLGPWLRDHLQSNRNVVRFLLPRDGATPLFQDRDLLVLARCVYLAEDWKRQNPEYGRLQTKYQKELRDVLKARFDRFAVIANFNFQQPANSRFHVERHKAEGAKIPEAIDRAIREDLFIPEDFEDYVATAAVANNPVGKLLRELKEPRPGGQDCIPWLGETLVKERLTRLCAKGVIAINLRGIEYLQAGDDETEEVAFRRMRGRLGTGKHLDETHVLLPQHVPATGGGTPGGTDPKPQPGTAGPTQPGGEPAAGGGAPGTDGYTDPGGTKTTGVDETNLGEIFGGGDGPSYSKYHTDPTSRLNLLDKLERWGIGPGAQVRVLAIKVDKLTGAQLKELIQKLPDGLTYGLELDKENA